MLKDKKFITLTILFSVFLFIVFVLPRPEAYGAGQKAFGGRVSFKETCTCEGDSSIVTITGGKSSGTYLYSPAARAHSYNVIDSGRNVKGLYTTGGVCMMAGDPCYEVPITQGTINMFGVSF